LPLCRLPGVGLAGMERERREEKKGGGPREGDPRDRRVRGARHDTMDSTAKSGGSEEEAPDTKVRAASDGVDARTRGGYEASEGRLLLSPPCW